MWPGVLGLSSPDFKQNSIAVVFARNELVQTRIEQAQAGVEAQEPGDGEGSSEEDEDRTNFVPVAVGRMAANSDNVN